MFQASSWPYWVARRSAQATSCVLSVVPAIALVGVSGEACGQSSGSTQTGVKAEVAASIATFGIEFSTGIVSILSPSHRSSIPPAEAEVIGQQGTALLNRYNRSVREAAFGANLLHSAIQVGIVSGGVMGTSTVVGAAPTAALTIIAQAGNDKVREYLVGDMVAKASAVLTKGIDGMNSDQYQTMVALLKAGKHEEAANHFEKSTLILSKMRSTIVGDAEAQRMLDDAVAVSLSKGSAEAIRSAGEAVAKVANLEGQFLSHVQGVTDFTRKTAVSLVAMESDVDEVRKGLASVQTDLVSLAEAQSSTSFQVQVIQDVLFDQQSPAARLAMLRSGAKPGLTADQFRKLEALLKVQVKQQEIIATATTIVGYARDLDSILGNFGVQDERLSQAVRYGSAASTALEQAFGGNYLGAIATVSGLFGGARPDPVQEQFKRVFAELSKISEKLDNVLELQVETLRAIGELSKQVAEVQRRIEYRFDRVDFELARLNQAAQVLIWEKVEPCGNAWSVQNEPRGGQYDPVSGRFVSFIATYEYTVAHGDKAFKCANALDGIFYNYRRQNFVGNPLSLSFVQSRLSGIGIPNDTKNGQYGLSPLENYRDNLHAPAFRLLEHGWTRFAATNPAWGNMAGAYALLSTPAATAGHLKARIDTIKSGTAIPSACKIDNSLVGRRLKVYLCSDLTTYEEAEAGGRDLLAHNRARSYLEDPLVRDQVGELTKYAMLVAGPRELAKSDSSPGSFTIDDLAERKSPVSYGRPLLAGAMMISDASVAQQAMIYGDLTAWFIYDALWDPVAKRFRQPPESIIEKDYHEVAVKLLRNQENPWLQRNVLMLILQSAEKACKGEQLDSNCARPTLLYRLAYNRFFPLLTKGDDPPTLTEPQTSQVEAAESILQNLFDLHADVTFTYADSKKVSGVEVPIPRQVLLNLDGYSLPMPSVSDWESMRIVYPPLMHERLADRAVLARRFANYASLDGMDSESRSALVSILANGESAFPQSSNSINALILPARKGVK